MSCKKDCIYYESCPHVETSNETKMTNEAAHFYLEDFQREITNHRQAYSDDFIQAHGKALEALEKQIPKKPPIEGDGYDDNGQLIFDTWLCPCCDEAYEVDYDKYAYCPNCGQKIDRSEMP